MSSFYDSTDEVAILRERIKELGRIRQGFTAHLGSSLYDATKDNDELRWGRESLYDGIATCDAERERMLQRIADLEATDNAEVKPVEQEAIEQVVEEAPQPVEEMLVEEELFTLEPDPEPEPDPELAPVFESEAIEESFFVPMPDLMPEPELEPIPESEPIPEFAPEPQPFEPRVEEASQLVCPTCGATANPGNRFCMVCGTPLGMPAAAEPEPEPLPSVCPHCGSPVEPTFKFCMTCGQRL